LGEPDGFVNAVGTFEDGAREMVDVYEGATETLGGFDNEGGIDCDGLIVGAIDGPNKSST